MTTENGLQPSIGPLRRLSILSLRSRNSVHISQEELLLLDDCKRMVKEINRRVATFRDVLVSVGSVERDSTQVREELAKLRKQCIDLCRKAKTRMLPTVRSTTQEQNEQLYKYFNQFVMCVQLFHNELKISYSLVKSFPVHLPADQTTDSKTPGCSDRPSTAKTSQQSKDVPTICVGGERIQINISDPSNNEVAADLGESGEESPPVAEMVDPAELEYPELGRIRRETQEVRDLLSDIADLIPKSPTHKEEIQPTDEASPSGRKSKSKHSKSHRTSLGMCCTCRPDYL
ncbi:uncharacterized protein LOC141906046 [Tubulanus polymorphus]|uniref:uncharacterized protein LOC141906046 n=1 Tax=Tubulanus polymorphus TaxID=672921 RepID=UPI003DA69A80